MLDICEIFASIQGESTLQGLPCVFVRTAGCNLRCTWCDTPWSFTPGTLRTIDSIVHDVRNYKISYVCITGGEPLLQNGTINLSSRLLAEGFRVSVETNGTLDVSCLPRGTVRVIDIKCPSSGEAGSFLEENIDDLRPSDEYKFVLGDRNDFLFTLDRVECYGLSGRCAVLMSPVPGRLEPAELSEWMLSESPWARLSLQLHRFIWPDEERGR